MSITTIALISLAEIVGDFGFKGVARNPTLGYWTAGSLGYLGVIYFLIKALKTGNVMYVNGAWDGVSAIMGTIMAFLILGERLNTPEQYLGLGVIIIGIFLLKSGGVPF